MQDVPSLFIKAGNANLYRKENPMKLANVVTKTVVMLVLVAMCLIPLAAQATFWPYSFTFYDVTTTEIQTPPRAKSDNDTNWWIRIYDNGVNTISRTNVLGVRMNFSLNADGSKRSFASKYQPFNSYMAEGTEYPIPYIYYVKAGDLMVLGAKKDDSSSSSMVLRVSGDYAP